MRKVIIANQKGGVGKTTASVNLAVGLALAGRKTLLVDMDPQANATFTILGSQEPPASVYDLLINDYAVADVIVSTDHENLDLLPSDIELAGAEVELISAIGGQTRLSTKLENPPRLIYDYLIIDTPPSLGLLTINSLAAANEVFIPVSTSVFALKGIAQLERTIQQVKTNLARPYLHISGVIFTLFDYTNVAEDVINFIRERFGKIAFDTVIPKNIKLEEAHSRAQSIYTYAPKSAGATAYANLVGEVIARE